LDDLEEIARLYGDMYGELKNYSFPFDLNRAKLGEIISAQINSRLANIAVADADGRICGFIAAVVSKMDRKFENGNGLVGKINDLYVASGARRNGCAGKLLKFVENWFSDLEVGFCEINVLVENAAARKFWRSAGFEDFNILMCKGMRNSEFGIRN
jgi:ribosomal protein S18 acetylase RimI-like enzyme